MNKVLNDLYNRKPLFPPGIRARCSELSAYYPPEHLRTSDDVDVLLGDVADSLEHASKLLESFFAVSGYGKYQRNAVGVLSRINGYLITEHPCERVYNEKLVESRRRLNELRTPFVESICSGTIVSHNLLETCRTIAPDFGTILDKINLLVSAVATPVFDESRTAKVWVKEEFDTLDGMGDNSSLEHAFREESTGLYYRLITLLHQTDVTSTTPITPTHDNELSWPTAKGWVDVVTQFAETIPVSIQPRIAEAVTQLNSIRTLRLKSPEETHRIETIARKLSTSAQTLAAQCYILTYVVYSVIQVIATTLSVQWEYLFFRLLDENNWDEDFLSEVVQIVGNLLEK